MTLMGRMPKCGYCGRGVPDEVHVCPTREDLATRYIEDADYHPNCLERARERARRLKANPVRRERLR